MVKDLILDANSERVSTSPIHARLVLLRHGQSEANAADRFTGSADPGLTTVGREQAVGAARQLLEHDICPARIFRSTLRRCADTATIVANVLGIHDMPVIADAALNERDYGALTGLDKAQASGGESPGQRYRPLR